MTLPYTKWPLKIVETISFSPAPTVRTCAAIHISGIVQGVGFRPFVYRAALQFGITGFVQNDGKSVYIEAAGTKDKIQQFYNYLLSDAPPLAKMITRSAQEIQSGKDYDSFRIIESDCHYTGGNLFITPDFALCSRCRSELHNKSNRRYHYPFITCTDCGPRYSVVHALPFDRERTAMQLFRLCAHCEEEYKDAHNTRFHAQTNSCKDCGVQLQLFNSAGQEIQCSYEQVIAFVVEALLSGKIVAVKGIGGFLLLCDAASEKAVGDLRRRKHRPSKPFAVMYPVLEQIQEAYLVTTEERNALVSAEAPIVLLQRKINDTGIAHAVIAPHLNRVGVFLPYAPLLELILNAWGKPLVATSANVSGNSIIYRNERALKELLPMADYLLLHNRDITMPQDDSVLQFSSETNTKIILRTGRGLAPVQFFNIPFEKTAFASGSLLKSSFALAQAENVYVSQYLGNTDDFDAQQNYRIVAERFLDLMHAKPQTLVCDWHPDYFSTQYAREQSLLNDVPLLQAQHHKAHFTAVLAENDLLQSNEKILGVIWDGTGLGDDGHIWGSEFFVYQNKAIERIGHFCYQPVLPGDKMAKEPRLSALSYCLNMEAATDLLKNKFSETEWQYYPKYMHHSTNTLHSSAGRLFDAAASLLGLCDRQSYEGEAALLLEVAAGNYFIKDKLFDETYFVEWEDMVIDVREILRQIVDEIRNEKDKEKIALKFHFTLVKIIAAVAVKSNNRYIAFSGGVFQNTLLVDLLKLKLGEQYQLFFHQKLSPNDENISLGQLALMVA